MNATLKSIGLMVCLLILAVSGPGCSSTPVMVIPRPAANVQRLGHVEGSALGAQIMLFPAGINSRTRRAYDRALAQAPGATALTDVTIQESWIWFYVGSLRNITISGEAVK